MLSNKWTFSLTSFVVLIAFGLVCFVPSVFADEDANVTHHDLDVVISAAESMIDVSDKVGLQIASGRHRNDRDFDLDGDGISGALTVDAGTITADTDPGDVILISIKFSHSVNLEVPGASLEDIEEATAGREEVAAGKPATADSGGNFGADDIYAAAYDVEGRQLGVLPLNRIASKIIADFIDAASPGRNFLVSIHQHYLGNAYARAAQAAGTAQAETLSQPGFEISTLVFFIPKGISGTTDANLALGKDATVTRGIRKADFAHVISHFGPDAHQHLNNPSNQFNVDLVDADQGDPMYNKGISADPVTAATVVGETDNEAFNGPGSGTPGVVTIDQLSQRAGFIETGPFDVRIILTEEPKGGLMTDMILVEGGGSATKVTKGVTLRGALLEVNDTVVSTDIVQAERNSELTTAIATYYIVNAEEGEALVLAEGAALPEATGRDNMYYQYFVTIEPNPGVSGNLTISLNLFEDNVIPTPNRYIPLTAEQRVATRLSATQKEARDTRVMNETLTVAVAAGADTTSVKALATAVYKTRLNDDPKGIINLNPNLIAVTSKQVIPAGGYLVLASGADEATSGVKSVAATTVGKLTQAQKDYNVVYGFKLPFPADNLDSFFRNGGTINLVYADIPAATGSGTDESKGPTAAADLTGYTVATTNAYAAGTVIISEIMWGLDSAVKDSQYIELHNPGTAAITIDSKEWVITVGSLPTGYAAIDTVSNNPASGYWAVPGNGGVTAASPEYPTVIDLVSMSRVTDGTDGTAAASWAASMRPSANISGRRVGTPGAANAYVMPAAEPEPETEPEAPAAAVAKSGDLMISEIMVASNDGRLPQWIEIANVSATAVSVSGWSLEVENDSADPDVVGEGDTIVIDLGDVEIGADQVALVVTKEGRDTSGIGDGEGDLRADRIIDVQSAVSPDNARYTLISEMAFMLSLIPPQTGAVRKPDDVVGNLDGGWELPMSEGDRSSLIRRDADEIMGTDAAGWVLASDTMLNGAYGATYYGHANDMGTPGYNAGGNLPVELSKFGAKRDPLTGAVVITWSTQSELNNAGFFIKRSQQTHGKFVIVNPTMIAGAGTTAEKQSYTYTDATADPNIVYYYQIEDVSLDGNRQTLTRAHRLKGHVGAAGKATTTWGDLKSSRD